MMRRARENEKGDASPDTEAARAPEVLERLARAKPVAERRAAGEGPANSHSTPAIAKLAARSPAGFDVHAGVAILLRSRLCTPDGRFGAPSRPTCCWVWVAKAIEDPICPWLSKNFPIWFAMVTSRADSIVYS